MAESHAGYDQARYRRPAEGRTTPARPATRPPAARSSPMDLEAQWTNAANAAVAMVTTYGPARRGAPSSSCSSAGWPLACFIRLWCASAKKSPRIDRTVVLFLGNGRALRGAGIHLRGGPDKPSAIATTSFRRRPRCARHRHRPSLCRARSAISPPEIMLVLFPAVPHRRPHRDRRPSPARPA